jgi:alanine racemase
MIATLEIDLAAIKANVSRLGRLVAPARFAAVVKANAYGHGLVEVSRAIEDDAGLLCVYHAEEALALREARIGLPILVLGPVEAGLLEALHEANVAITLWDSGSYRAFVASLGRVAGRPFAVHVKVESGVGRYGFEPAAAPAAIAGLLADPDLRVEGVFTHLAAAEELESAFTADQRARFLGALAPLEAELRSRGVLRHAAASAAAMLYPALRLDMVRCGIAIYGLWPSAQTRAAAAQPGLLEPALRWSSRLVSVREVEAGRALGYGCSYTTTRPSRIAVVPLGYAEGLPRAVSNRGRVLVEGLPAPIVGRVCMNATLVDVTEIPAAHPGSTVTLIGRDGAHTVGADDWADWTGSINYEIVARLPAQLARSYVPAFPTKGLLRAVR